MYNLTVNTDYLNGRASPSGNGALVFPAGATLSTGFRKGDLLTSETYAMDGNGVTRWYKILTCRRNGTMVTLPSTVYASDGGSYQYLVMTPEPPPPPVVEFPTSVWLSMSVNGERKEYRLVE